MAIDQPTRSRRRRGPGKRFVDLTGQRIGLLTVIESVGALGPKYRSSFLCRCDCGGTRVVRADALLKPQPTASCGCLQRIAAAATLARWWRQSDRRGSSYRHGHAGNKPAGQKTSRTYNSWVAMRQRCHSPNATKYARYGGRGITVCDRWRESFDNFLADMGPRPEGCTLDRLNPVGNYEPGNCRWATPYEQWLNRRVAAGL